jgi:DNA-binding transcriptional MerR regulator
VEQLAQQTGMTVRNIRNHQSRGLLPPPQVVARVGYYGPEHVERLRLIREMQADGFNLSAIKRLLATGADQLRDLKRVIEAPFEAESPEIFTTEELAERFGPLDERTMAKALKLEVLVPLGDGRFEAPSPALLRAAQVALERGIPLAAALSVVERVKRNCESTSRAFVQLFMDELLRREEGWSDVVESIGQLRPVASETVLALFKQTMAVEIERAFAKELERQAKRS